jgi:hypothetical protein
MTLRFTQDISDPDVFFYKVTFEDARGGREEDGEGDVVAMGKWSYHVPRTVEGDKDDQDEMIIRKGTEIVDEIHYPEEHSEIEMFNHVMNLVNTKRNGLIGTEQPYFCWSLIILFTTL